MIYLAIVSVLWAFSFGLIGSTLSNVDAFFVATLRLSFATLVLLPFFRPKLLGGKNCFLLCIYGSIQFGVMYTCYMKAYQFLPSHLVALFSIFTPMYVVFIHSIRQHKFSPRYLLAATFSVIGAAIIKVQGTPSGDIWLGFALMQVAGISFAYGQIAYRDWKRSHPFIDDLAVFSMLTLGGALCAGTFSLFFSNTEYLVVSTAQWQAILYLGCIASGLGFFLWNKGATLSNAGELAAFNNAVVPLAVIVSLFIFKESQSLTLEDLFRLLTGGFFVVAAVIIAVKKGSVSE